jgi:hypothetical protein
VTPHWRPAEHRAHAEAIRRARVGRPLPERPIDPDVLDATEWTRFLRTVGAARPHARGVRRIVRWVGAPPAPPNYNLFD